VKRIQHYMCLSDGHHGSIPKGSERKADACNEGQEHKWRSHTVDRELSLREDGSDGNQRQCLIDSHRGGSCPTALTQIVDSHCDSHRWTAEVGGSDSASQSPLLRRQPRMGGFSEGREPGVSKAWGLWGSQHPVAQQMRSPVGHCNDEGSTHHTQERPQEAPPPETHSQSQGSKWQRPIQQ